MVKTHSQRAVEARVLSDLRLAFKIDKIREAIFGQQGYDAVLLDTRANYEGKTDVERGEEMYRVYWSESMRTCWRSVEDRKKFVLMMAREEIINEDRDIASGLLKACGVVGHTGCFKCNLVQESWTAYWKTPNLQRFGERCISTPSSPLPNTENHKKKRRVREREILTDDFITAEGGKDKRKAVTRSLNYKLREEAEIEEVLQKLQKLSKLVRTNAADSHSGVEATDGAYLSSSSSRPCFFDLSSAGRVWNDNLLWVFGECLQRSDEEPLELNNRTITKEINCKVWRKESFIDAVFREGTELEAVLKELEISRFKRVTSMDDKLARLNEMPDGPVDMATISSTVVRNLAKRMAIKRGAASRSVTSDSVDDSSKRRKFARALRGLKLGFQDREAFQLELEKEREVVVLKLKEVRAKSVAEAERLVTVSATSRNNLAGKLYQLRYTKAEIMAFSEENYEEKEIIDEEEVEEMEVGLNVVEKIAVDNLETINQEIESSRLRVVDLEGLLEVEKKSSAELQAKEEFAISSLQVSVLQVCQYASVDLFPHQLSLKLEEAKRQLEDKTTTIWSRDSTLIQLTRELVELKEKAVSGSRHEAELAEYRIRGLNKEISDMKCNIRALNEQLLKREIDLDTARTNLAMSEADFEKLSSSIVGKDR
ncbi:hypothetical protein GIB67_041027 [Kingdonia uniflora]|uniref:Uncharacterized protein n=1 Tax=Kingdonia uniflora TaxID=39325 RepID=A0A7J7NC93_9MAGN|nr:hypothetical protein GIB67_041027 [Kingdonia uniflora]